LEEIDIKRLELGIIHNELSELIGIDDGTNPDGMSDDAVLFYHGEKLELLRRVLNNKKAHSSFRIAKEQNRLNEINRKIKLFEGEI